MPKPAFSVCGRPATTVWGLIGQVSRCLKQHGYEDQAREFRSRAFALDPDDEDSTELFDLMMEYVTFV